MRIFSSECNWMRGDPFDSRDNVRPDDVLVGRLNAIDGDCAPDGVLVVAG